LRWSDKSRRQDAHIFNPDREWKDDELWHDQVYAARNPHSTRFSPFTHTPRDCIGKNFARESLSPKPNRTYVSCPDAARNCAEMEMRTIITQIFRNFTFELSEDEKAYAADGEAGQSVARGLNNGTMGPSDVDYNDHGSLGAGGFGGIHGMHCYAIPRNSWASDWASDLPEYWPTNRGEVPGLKATEGPDMSIRVRRIASR